MTEPASQTTSGSSTSFAIAGPNGGTLIRTTNTAATCFYKTDYRGDPHEFGAYGDGEAHGGNRDTVAIENWLGAYGMVTNPLATNPPANFGPWIASIPANYVVSTPLSCPPNATIQGTENLQNGNIPRTNFVAAPGFAGISYPYVANTPLASAPYESQAVFAASPYCRLSGVAVTGNGFDLGTTGNTSASITINGLGSITGVAIGNAVAGADVNPDLL